MQQTADMAVTVRLTAYLLWTPYHQIMPLVPPEGLEIRRLLEIPGVRFIHFTSQKGDFFWGEGGSLSAQWTRAS